MTPRISKKRTFQAEETPNTQNKGLCCQLCLSNWEESSVAENKVGERVVRGEARGKEGECRDKDFVGAIWVLQQLWFLLLVSPHI